MIYAAAAAADDDDERGENAVGRFVLDPTLISSFALGLIWQACHDISLILMDSFEYLVSTFYNCLF